MEERVAGESNQQITTEDHCDGEKPVFSDGQLCYLGYDVEEIPPELIAEYASHTVRLDLSFNRIRTLQGLEKFVNLRELILDNNELTDDASFPDLRHLSTLYLNKNRFIELDPLMQQLKRQCPRLHYLSLLGNAACPNQLSSSDKDDEDYQRYRYFVLFHLPHLKFLDSSPVLPAELVESKRRGQFMQVVRPSERREEEEGDEALPKYSPLPSDTTEQYDYDSKQLGFYGRTKYTYYGRHSEGNRFIRNKDL